MRLFKALIIVMLVAQMGCGAEPRDWTEFGVYDKAIGVDNYVFPNGTANQVFYKVKTDYPSTEVLEFYKNSIKMPWVECGENDSWKSFGDVSGNEPLFVHQLLKRWVNRDKNRLVLLAIKYRSQGSENREVPDNNIQNVYLIEYQESNIEETIKALGIACNGV